MNNIAEPRSAFPRLWASTHSVMSVGSPFLQAFSAVLLAEGSTSWDWVVRECHPDWYTHHCWVDKNMMDDVS